MGSLLVMLAVLGIANKIKSSTSLLIVGLMIGAATSSIVSVLQFMSGADQQQSFLIWTFGSVGGLNWTEIAILAIILGLGTTGAVLSIKSLNAWLLGDHYAANLGVNLKSAKMKMILSTCLMTGAVTAFCGPIAFIGIAVPHMTKLLMATSEHKILIPWVAVMGATLLLICDIIAQLPGSAHTLPINAITALIGAPVVIWIILRGNKVIA
jgi:iron complex transport system permease protein